MTYPTDAMVEAALDALSKSSEYGFIDRMKVAVKAADRAVWQPIEEVPEYGIVFDVWTKYGRVTDCVKCRQSGEIYAYCPESAGFNTLIKHATHFRLTPPPPKEGE